MARILKFKGVLQRPPTLLAATLVVAAACLAAVDVVHAATRTSTGALPPVEHARIHAVLAPYDFFPASLPKGLIYISWKETSLDPTVCGTNATIEFAAAGDRQINWSSSRDCDGQGRVRCSTTGYPGYVFGMGYSQTAVINGRRVYFSPGNHGSNAWACIPLTVGGAADVAVVGIWESNFITPRQAMNLVAYARR